MAFHTIQVVDERKKVIFEGMICFLPIAQRVLDQRCLEYYQAEVCTVRKENMRRLLYLEIEDVLLAQIGEQADYDGRKKMPDTVRRMLDYGEQMLYFKIVK